MNLELPNPNADNEIRPTDIIRLMRVDYRLVLSQRFTPAQWEATARYLLARLDQHTRRQETR